jgi:transposase
MIEFPDFRRKINLCLDKGYDSAQIREVLRGLFICAHIHSRGEERCVLPPGQAKRWIVEAFHSWLNRFRRLLVRWEKLAVNYLGMLQLACAIIVWRRVETSRKEALLK